MLTLDDNENNQAILLIPLISPLYAQIINNIQLYFVSKSMLKQYLTSMHGDSIRALAYERCNAFDTDVIPIGKHC